MHLIEISQNCVIKCIGPVAINMVCANGKKHPQPYFSLNKDNRTHLIYLGDKRQAAAKHMVDNYKLLIEIVEEMTVINMALLKNDAIE